MTLPPVMPLSEQPAASRRAPWRLKRGATITTAGVTFTVWAPDAKGVAVHIACTGTAGDVDRDALGVRRPHGEEIGRASCRERV